MNRSRVTAMIIVVASLAPAVVLCVDIAGPPAEVIVDADHDQAYVPAGQARPAYRIPPAARFAVDASGYRLPIPSRLQDQISCPNAIHFASKRGKYSCAWPTQGGRIVLGPDNLVPLVDSGPFTGLVAGDTCMIAIGHEERVGDTLQLFLIWAGMIEVVAAPGSSTTIGHAP